MNKQKIKLFILAAITIAAFYFPSTAQAASLSPETLSTTTNSRSKESVPAVGDEFTVDSIKYSVTSVSDDYEVAAFDTPKILDTIFIPSTVTHNNITYKVTSIPDGAFYGEGTITKIIISEGVKTVGASAFLGCNAVTQIELPSTLENFTTEGFMNLETIILASKNQHFQLIDGVLFTKDGTKLWLYPSAMEGTSYTVPEGTIVIGECAFYGNQYLQTIALADSVTTIEAYAFDTLNALTTMTFGSNVSSIGDHNLRTCSELRNVTFKNSGRLGNFCVYDCELLETVIIDGPLNGWGLKTFYKLPSLKAYDAQNSYYNSRDGALFLETKLLRYPAGKTDPLYVLPDDTTLVAPYAFNFMQHTTEIVLNPGIFLDLYAFHYPNENSPISVYFRDKETVSLSTSSSGVFVELYEGSHIYLPTEESLQSFNTYTSAVNPASSATVEVKTIPSTALTLNKTSVTLKSKETFSLTGTLTPYYSTDEITWSSDNDAVAFVNADGVIEAIRAGECVITATTESGITKTCAVSVATTDISLLDFSAIADQTYTGEALTPDITIKDGEKTLTKGKDYTVAYNNNVNAGEGTVTITCIGSYSGSRTIPFNIYAKSIKKANISAIADQTYTGEALTPDITIKDGEKTLTNGTDYTVTYRDNKNIGTASVVITGQGNYCSTITDTFTIKTIPLTEAKVTLHKTLFTYNGKERRPHVIVTFEGETLEEDRDYTLTFKNNKNAGTAAFVIKGKGNYSGTVTGTFTITPVSLTEAEVSLSATSYSYNGKAKEPEVTVKLGSKTLKKDEDYTVTYRDNKNIGTASVDITGKGNYSGTVTDTFTIKQASLTSLTEAEVSLSATSYFYNGKAKEPEVTVKLGNKTLKKDEDYTVTYKNNKNAGTASVVIKGKGNYCGTITDTFTIKTIPLTEAKVTLHKTIFIYNGKAKEPKVTVMIGSKTLKKDRDYTVAYKNNTDIGKATVIIKGKGNYSGSLSKTFTINVKKGSSFTYGVYKYKVTGSSTVAFAGLKNTKLKEVVVADKVTYGGKTFKVTAIAGGALENNTNVTSITIGKYVKSINTSAFEGCKKLSKVTFGTSVTKIGAKVFKNCTALKSIKLPSKLKEIGKQAFYRCKNLKTITIKSTKLESVEKYAFKGIYSKATIKVPEKQYKSYVKLMNGKGQGSKVKIVKY